MHAMFTVYLHQKSGDQGQLCFRSYPRDATLLIAILPGLRAAISKREPWQLYNMSPNVALNFNGKPTGKYGNTTLTFCYKSGGYLEFNANKRGRTALYQYVRHHYRPIPPIEFDAVFLPATESEALATIDLKRRA